MLKPSAKVGVCPECEQNVPLEPVPGRRWGMPTIVAEHSAAGSRWCPGQGQRTLSRSRAWGWPEWDQMSDADRRRALVHVMVCSGSVTSACEAVHRVRYQGRGLRWLASRLACVHAWDQTGGWDQALSRWGVESVRGWVRGHVPVEAERVLSHYGWGMRCQPFVEGERMVGVLVEPGARRPKGWLWKHTPPGPAVAVPDRRTALGRSIARHLQVVETVSRERVGQGASDEQLGGAVRRGVASWRPVDVEVGDGEWVMVCPARGQVST